ncbi:hypothetical protein SRABI128_03377 [Microbacterium sp. Bi128]|nr:hypothetical protein SRABI128_03377 [Microbacterium sp. Bi128]
MGDGCRRARRDRAPSRRGRDRLLPARREDLLGHALPASARARVDLGGHARRRGRGCRPLPGRDGLAHLRVGSGCRPPTGRGARRGRPRQPARGRCGAVRGLRPPRPLPARGPPALDPRGASCHGARRPRRRGRHRRGRRGRRHVGHASPGPDPAGAAARREPAEGDRRVGRRGARRGAGVAGRPCRRHPPPSSAADALRVAGPGDRGGRWSGRRRDHRDRPDGGRTRPQLPGGAGPAGNRQDLRRLARHRPAGRRARVSRGGRGAVARDRRAHARTGDRGRRARLARG